MESVETNFLKHLKTNFMARQRGIFPLEGTIGNVTFLKTRDGYLAKEKTHIPASRIANDPAFQRTRENNQEFGRAGKAAKLFGAIFRAVVNGGRDSRMTSRLMKVMMAVIKMDLVNTRGLRNVIDGEAQLLDGFEFNANSKITTVIYVPYASSIDRVTGVLKVDFPVYVPMQMINAPVGTTHYRIIAAGGEIDFQQQQYNLSTDGTAFLDWDSMNTAPFSLSCNLPVNSTQPLFLALGIEFYQEVNGTMYHLKNGSYNGLGVIKVDTP